MDKKDFSVVDLSQEGLRAIPANVLMNAVHVISLDLSGNCFNPSALTSLSKFTNVTSLKLNGCGQSAFPEELFYLQKLEKLSLMSCEVAPSLSPSISKLKALKELHIDGCGLTHVPEELWTLEKLEKLSLMSWEVAPSLSPSISKLKALKELSIFSRGLTHVPEELWTLETLEKLSLMSREVAPSLSPAISKLKALKELRIDGCGLTHVPEELWTLETLEKLSLMSFEVAASLSPSISKLKALKELRISSRGLTHVPEELWTLETLEKLSLMLLEVAPSLSPSISKLKALKELHIDGCGLTHVPEELWTLETMEKLSLRSMEMAQGLSPSISKLKALKELHIDGCGLTHVPEELRTLEKLQILDLSNNRLVEIPADAVLLPNLYWLDLSNSSWKRVEGNRIKKLPESLKDSRIEKLHLDGNPIVRPPEAIWKQGVQAIKLYFKEVTSGEQKHLRVDTINMIGESKAGKTSIAKSLAEGKPITAAEDDRTRVMQRLQANLTSDSSDSPVWVNDFGGHHIYRSIIPIFLPCSGLTILAYNLMATDWDDQQRKVKSWLLTAIAKSEKIRLVVAGTRSDLCQSYEAALALKSNMQRFVLDAVDTLKRDVAKHISRLTDFQMRESDHSRKSSLQKRLNDLVSLKIKLEEAELSFSTVSCNESCNDFHKFRELVCSKVKEPEAIPARWWQVMQDILKVYQSGFPRQNMEQVEEVYRKYVSDDPQCMNLPVILRYLANSSQIIWVENDPRLCRSIFYSPQGIVDICTKILDHRAVEHPAEYQAAQCATWSTSVCGDNCTRRLPPEWEEATDFERNRYKEGILQETLLKKLLYQCEEHEINEIVCFMEHFDLISEIKLTEATETQYVTADPESTEAREYVITGNLPEEEPRKLKTLLEQDPKKFSSVFVSLSFVGCIIPLAFFDTSLSSILAVAKKHCGRPASLPWKYGLCIRFGTLVLLVKCHEKKKEVTFTAYSVDSKQSPWFLLYPVLKRLQENISASWPGVAPEWQIMCPGCWWLNERRCTEHEIARRPILFKDLTLHLQEGPRGKHEPQVFEDCIHRVPRSLCHFISQDSFTDEEQKEIAQFYQDLDVDWNNKNRPPCDELSSNRQKIAEPDPEVDHKISDLHKTFRKVLVTLVKKLDSSSVEHIIDELTAARSGCGLISEEDSQLITAEKADKSKARRLLRAIDKRGDDAIEVLIKALSSPDIGRDDLAELLLRKENGGNA